MKKERNLILLKINAKFASNMLENASISVHKTQSKMNKIWSVSRNPSKKFILVKSYGSAVLFYLFL